MIVNLNNVFKAFFVWILDSHLTNYYSKHYNCQNYFHYVVTFLEM